MTTVLLFILCSVVFVSAYLVLNGHRQKKQLKMLSEKQADELRQLEVIKNTHESLLEKNSNLQLEKSKAEEKNKKLWAMSETVHKERRIVDEANEQLLIEKEKLEADKKKLDDKVKKLWSTSTAIHKEKERINELKIEIEHKHQEILDSVNYAKRIQSALLASKKMLIENLPEHFVFFQPKDIVSGDFYWIFQNDFALLLLTAPDMECRVLL